MIINGSNIVGAKIVSKETQEIIGRVADIVLDPEKKNVQAFLLGDELSGKAVAFEDTLEITDDSISIRSEKVLKNAPNMIKQPPEENELALTTVLTEKGEELGYVADIFFDTDTGKTHELEVRQKDEPQMDAALLVKIDDVISIGKNAVTVKPQTNKKSADLLEKAKNLLG